MVDIEPYKQIQKTNIKEHNDLVAKINEIIDVLNSTQIETVVPKITALETDVSTIKATDSLQWTDIESLKDSQSAQDVTIGSLDAQVKGVTESLVSDIAIIDGITTGNMKVRIEREKATAIDSNDYNIQKPVSMELIQGSGPSTFKAQITLSDGTIIRSDDFMFTTEAIGTDVYISSFVFKNGNIDGTISADIGLSNGTTIEANNFVVPMDPSLLNTVQDLSTRLSAVEGGSVGGLDELKAQIDTNTASISTLTGELDDLDVQKADQNNETQEIVLGTATVKSAVRFDGAVDGNPSSTEYGIVGGTAETHPFSVTMKKTVLGQQVNAPIGELALLDGSGNPKNFSAGEVWEEVDLENFPTDWVAGDRVKIEFSIIVTAQASNYNSAITVSMGTGGDRVKNAIKEYSIPSTSISFYTPYDIIFTSAHTASVCMAYVHSLYDYSNWNGSGTMIDIDGRGFNGSYITLAEQVQITRTNITRYISRMWRLKK